MDDPITYGRWTDCQRCEPLPCTESIRIARPRAFVHLVDASQPIPPPLPHTHCPLSPIAPVSMDFHHCVGLLSSFQCISLSTPPARLHEIALTIPLPPPATAMVNSGSRNDEHHWTRLLHTDSPSAHWTFRPENFARELPEIDSLKPHTKQ